MALTGRTVIGVFDEAANADRAIDALQAAGFSSSDIHHSGRGTTSTSGANEGGGFFAGVRNFFTGNDTADTTTGGHVANDLTNMGVSNDEAQYYENEYNNGRTIVSVNAGDSAEEAKTILDTNGAYNYANRRGGTASTASTYSTTTGTPDTGYADAATTGYTAGTTDPRNTNYTDTTNTTTNTPATNYTDTTNTTNTPDADYANQPDVQRMRLREEQLNVSKQPVQAGEVSLGKNVVEEQKTVNVPVTHEEVYIENRPVSDTTVNDNTPIGEGENIRVPVSEERVNVSKDTVVTCEVSIDKRAVQGTQQVTDTVRREEARLDQSGNPRVSGNDVNTYNTTNTNQTGTNYDTTNTDQTGTTYDTTNTNQAGTTYDNTTNADNTDTRNSI